jgi:hypothetical protein
MICIVERQKDVDITSLLPHKKVSGPGELLFIGYSVQLCEHSPAELSFRGIPARALFALIAGMTRNLLSWKEGENIASPRA